jgi:glutamine synthetase
MRKFEYVWLDGYRPTQSLRSKVKIDEYADVWSFDGSSTQQATGGDSDCILNPVAEYRTIDRIRADATQTGPGLEGTYVMCEVLSSDHEPHESNQRTHCMNLVSDDWWFGFEQEYFMYKDGRPLGWPTKKTNAIGGTNTPRPQGDYYCGVGDNNVVGREIVDRHTEACMNANIGITGTNAEVALGQWEYQVLGAGIRAGDDLWMSRYILQRIAEMKGVSIDFRPKPQKGDWNGSGMHTNFSNDEMRNRGSLQLHNNICEMLKNTHKQAIKVYGADNAKRLTGKHETQSIKKFSYGISDRGASIRIPIFTVDNNWNGYLEDRRPAGNADPYRVMRHIVESINEDYVYGPDYNEGADYHRKDDSYELFRDD